MNKEEIDSYFINKQYLKKVTNNNKNEKCYTKKDYKKYKKDVYKIIREMMNGNKEHDILREKLDILIGDVIEYIKYKKIREEIKNEQGDLEKKKTKKEIIQESLITKVEEGNREMFRNLKQKTTDVGEKLGVKIQKTKKKESMIIPKQRILEKKVMFNKQMEDVKVIDN